MSAVVVVLAVASSVAGLRAGGVYRGEPSVAAMLRGYDLVVLTIAAPLLAASLLALRRSPRARLVWLAMLAFTVYHYAYYVFGAANSPLLPLHAALLALSAAVLAGALRPVGDDRVAAAAMPRWAARLPALVLLALGLSLAAMWASLVARSAMTGAVLAEPSRLVLPAAMTKLGATLDLSLLVPGYLLAGVLVWRAAAWGRLLASVLLVSGTVHQVAYMTALWFQARAGIPGASAWDPAEPVIAAAFAATAAILLVVGTRGEPRRPGLIAAASRP